MSQGTASAVPKRFFRLRSATGRERSEREQERAAEGSWFLFFCRLPYRPKYLAFSSV